MMESVSDRLLVPVTIFVGINSSIALDAGYVVLPALAAALFTFPHSSLNSSRD